MTHVRISYKQLLIGITAIFILLIAVSYYLINRSSYDLINPKYGPIVEAIYGMGKVKTDRTYELKLAVIKTIKKLYVHEGDQVKKGDKLIRFDGGLEFAAPFAGTITLVAFTENQSVFPQQTIIQLEDLTTKYIEVSLEQQGALRVHPGQTAKISFESIRGDQVDGVVSTIFPRNEEFLAHIKAKLADNILPGMTADVAIEVGQHANALLVPTSALTNGHIRIIRDGKKLSEKLTIGGIDGNWAEVLSGDVKVSDQVMVKRKK